MTRDCIKNREKCRKTCKNASECTCCCWFFHCSSLKKCDRHTHAYSKEFKHYKKYDYFNESKKKSGKKSPDKRSHSKDCECKTCHVNKSSVKYIIYSGKSICEPACDTESKCCSDSSSSSSEDNCLKQYKVNCQTCTPNSLINPNIHRNDPYALYSKALPHDNNAFVDKKAYCKYFNALLSQNIRKVNEVPLGGTTKQVDPAAAWSNDMPRIVKCGDLFKCFKLPKISSPEYAANLVEEYAMALSRDVPFSDYAISPIITASINSMSILTAYNGPALTPSTIFRGQSHGDLIGPYISQFLYLDYKEGGFTRNQKYPSYGPTNFMVTFATTLSVENGTVTESFGPQTPAKYILDGRDLSIVVHADEPFLLGYHAALVLFTLNTPINPGIPINANNGPFINLTARPDVEISIGTVTRYALLAAWCFKNRALFLRPEEGGIIVERSRLNIPENPQLSPEILTNPILNDIFALYSNHLLPQAYPEGSPAHPSWPSGHATIIGANITILKFFFDGSTPMALFAPDATGANLVPTGIMSNVNNELNKLASNCAIGRNWAGIHYRTDAINGIKLGEKIALEYLGKHIKAYPQKVKVSLRLYCGKKVTISNYC